MPVTDGLSEHKEEPDTIDVLHTTRTRSKLKQDGPHYHRCDQATNREQIATSQPPSHQQEGNDDCKAQSGRTRP